MVVYIDGHLAHVWIRGRVGDAIWIKWTKISAIVMVLVRFGGFSYRAPRVTRLSPRESTDIYRMFPNEGRRVCLDDLDIHDCTAGVVEIDSPCYG